jgi:phospholipid/cholesterol/gamma-HCH transport system substrate-binding protein
MNSSQSTLSTRLRVGLFTVLGLVLLGLSTVLVNDKPFWFASCQLVHINVEDGTGLRAKSGVRSLGIEIGYLKTVELTETFVRLGICITAPIEVLPDTKAYIRGEGFLGDKFVELKPVKYVGGSGATPTHSRLWDLIVTSAYAEEENTSGKQIPVGNNGGQDVQQLVQRVDTLVNEMTGLTTNLKSAINPDELRSTMRQLNKTLENASRALAPEGGLNQTAQRSLAKLEDAIGQLRDIIGRVNRGEGSVGMVLNDPSYAEEMRQALRNMNALLSKVGGIRIFVDLGFEKHPVYDGSRGWFKLLIHPSPDRYYLIGAAVDPRGKRTIVDTTTQYGTSSTTVRTTQVEPGGLTITAMLGKIFLRRIDLSAGVLNGDGTGSLGLNLWIHDSEDVLRLQTDAYSHGQGEPLQARFTGRIKLPLNTYVIGGLESNRQIDGRYPYFVGAGVMFDDQDIKMLFAFL